MPGFQFSGRERVEPPHHSAVGLFPHHRGRQPSAPHRAKSRPPKGWAGAELPSQDGALERALPPPARGEPEAEHAPGGSPAPGTPRTSRDPLPPPVRHRHPTQIPGMRGSTSSAQGHLVDEPEALAWAMAGGNEEDALAIMAAARQGRGRRSRARRRRRHPPSFATRPAADPALVAAILLSMDEYDVARAAPTVQAARFPNQEPQEEPDIHPLVVPRTMPRCDAQ